MTSIGGVFRRTSKEDRSEAVAAFRTIAKERCSDVAGSLCSVLLAPACLVCATPLERPLEGPICSPCWESIRPLSPPLCRTCGDALVSWRAVDGLVGVCARCRRRPPPLACARSAGAYEGTLRHVIHSLKYRRCRTLARSLAALMRDRGSDVLSGADLAVPVPLHWRRRQVRGFNQAADLARGLGLPVVHALRRVRPTTAQFGLSTVARLRNVRGAFAPPRSRWFGRRRPDARIQGACVVLVDDVCTTGATLGECAAVLLEGGAREVRAITAARALTRRA
jgi:ComF family protein